MYIAGKFVVSLLVGFALLILTPPDFAVYAQSNPVANKASDIGFAGEWSVEDINYLRDRWYIPQSGQFLTRDRFRGFLDQPQTHNSSYYTNNPVNYLDRTGFASFRALPPLARNTVVPLRFANNGTGKLPTSFFYPNGGPLINFRTDNDPATLIRDPRGGIIIDAHGGLSGKFFPKPFGDEIPLDYIDAVTRSHPRFAQAPRAWFLVCNPNGAMNNAFQELADRWGIPVDVPNDSVWVSPYTIRVGPSHGVYTGKFFRMFPKNYRNQNGGYTTVGTMSGVTGSVLFAAGVASTAADLGDAYYNHGPDEMGRRAAIHAAGYGGGLLGTLGGMALCMPGGPVAMGICGVIGGMGGSAIGSGISEIYLGPR